MSRRETRPVFASNTAFDVLASQSDEEKEEVEEVEESQPEEIKSVKVADPPPSKSSKSAQKRAARSSRQQQRQEQKLLKQQKQKLPLSKQDEPRLGTQANSVQVPDIAPKTEDETSHNHQNSDLKAMVTTVPEAGPHSPTNVSPERGRSRSPSTKLSTFHPDLPPLPMPYQSPIVRKRKASQDLTSDSHTKESKIELAKDVYDTVAHKKPSGAESSKKIRNAGTRTLWTLIMLGGFLTLLAMGHAYMILLVLLCSSVVYREVTRLFTLREDPESKDPWSKTLNWYFFAVTNYFLYGESIIYYFKHVMFADALLLPFATNHRLISFMLYTLGFVGFVASLRKQYLKQQFGMFCWVHITLFLIVVSSHFIVNNILEGLIWFWVPASLVICNDVFAYIWGVTIGRTPLIKLSPKKTVEGFVGAFFSTLLFSLFWGTFFMRYDYMICPVKDLGVSILSPMACKPNSVFVWREWVLPAPLQYALSTILGHSIQKISWAPYQFHLLVMATFASLVAPFGGFFASGFKRAFDIKDFGDSIPGHGGMTDRMDCQFLMGMFSYVYYSSLIKQHHVTVGSLLQAIVSGLSLDEQVELFKDLKHYLEGRGVLL